LLFDCLLSSEIFISADVRFVEVDRSSWAEGRQELPFVVKRDEQSTRWQRGFCAIFPPCLESDISYVIVRLAGGILGKLVCARKTVACEIHNGFW